MPGKFSYLTIPCLCLSLPPFFDHFPVINSGNSLHILLHLALYPNNRMEKVTLDWEWFSPIVSLWCWQIWQLAVAAARSALVSGSPCCQAHLCHHGHSFMGPLGNDRDGLGKRLNVQRMGHPIGLMIKFLLFWSHLLRSMYMGHQYLHILRSFGEIYPHILLA